MHVETKNFMLRNLHSFLSAGNHGLKEHQVEMLERVEPFLRTPVGENFSSEEQNDDPLQRYIKRGDFFEIVAATGVGKTRAFGTMAMGMGAPALIVTPRNLLNRQTKIEFCDEMGFPEELIAVYDSQQPTAEIGRVLYGNPPPQFLVTGYRSLTSLIEKHSVDFTDPKSRHYRPLGILDEFHESQGPRTVQTLKKLKNKILLAGFTATDAGAGATLFEDQAPIYELPLVEAIDRGLLCYGIRTGVIDVAIDKAWVDSFLRTPRGLDYRREDVERFARSPSVIEGAIRFHLQYQDSQLGRIHRLPTIFYTQGVDAAREGAQEFNKRARAMRLSTRAAYVSGDMPYYESLPIIEQFKLGKIQALWNDRLLGMGFNYRNATVCYSLKPSRLPHIPEQQLGRVGREEANDYRGSYGQNKVSLAINVCGQGMNPVLFGEILGDKPAIYRRDYSPFQTQVEGFGERGAAFRLHLPEGINVHIDYNDMQSVLARTIKAREALPERTNGWLTNREMASQSKGDKSSIYDAYNRPVAKVGLNLC